jgi:hypothetical protein
MYDPSAVVDATTHGFTSYDLGAVYDHRTALEGMFPTLGNPDSVDRQLEGVSIPDLGRATMQLSVDRPAERVLAGEVTPAAGAGVVRGSFEPEKLTGLVERYAGQSRVEPAGTAAGRDLHRVDVTPLFPTTTFGADRESVVFGMAPGADASGTDALDPVLSDDGSGYFAASGPARTIAGELEPTTATTGVFGDLEPVARRRLPAGEGVDAVAGGLRGIGKSTTVTDDLVSVTVVGAYASGRVPEKRALETVTDRVRDELGGITGENGRIPTDGLTVGTGEGTATVSFEATPERMFERQTMGGAFTTLALYFPVVVPLLFPSISWG